jgi:DNA polymerase-3 subunit gamma/tau
LAFKKKDKTKDIGKLPFERKYRPMTFDGYVGNAHVKRDISLKLSNDNLSHFTIFYGGSGTGKTTMARLLSRDILCPNKTPEGKACGVCDVCKEITEECIMLGSPSVGKGALREPNLSADTGKQFMTDLMDEVTQKPLPPYTRRVVILDEAHKASNSSQNAMLKSLEDIPDYLYYILCTTEPERLIDTIKTRGSQYKVKKPTIKEMVDRLIFICDKENIRYDIKALEMLCRKCSIVPRKCIKTLDDLKDYSVISQQVVIDHLDIIENEVFVNFFELCQMDIIDIFQGIDKLIDTGITGNEFVDGLMRFILDAINMKYGNKLETYSADLYKKTRKLFKDYSYDDMALMIRYMNRFAETSYTSDSREESALKELAITLGKPRFFMQDLKHEPARIEVETQKASHNYKVNEAEKRNQGIVKDTEFDSMNDILGAFKGGYIVENSSKIEDHKEEYNKQFLSYANPEEKAISIQYPGSSDLNRLKAVPVTEPVIADDKVSNEGMQED